MKEIFEPIISKLSQYEILNNLIPGAALCILLKYILDINLLRGNEIEQVFIMYLLGIINGRVSSVIIETILKKIKFVKFAEYPKFLDAEAKDKKLTILSQTNNYYRSLLSVVTIVLVVYGWQRLTLISEWLQCHSDIVVLISLVLLFAFSYRKQTSYIRKCVENLLK